MIDSDLKKQLDLLDVHLVEIRKSNAVGKAFWRGILSGIGSIIGVAIALIIVGFILNAMGVIPAFREQAGEWRETLDRLGRIR
jgi:hypothetical protein